MSYKKSINVVLNSNNSVSGTTQSSTFFVDWPSLLDPSKQYYLHFVYIGQANNYTGSKLATISASFVTNTYTTGTRSSQILGLLMPTVLAGASSTSFLQSLDNTNVPILMQCPLNQTFTVSIFDNQATPAPWTDNLGALPGAYVLVLRFTEV
jgi:hypothetical protein